MNVREKPLVIYDGDCGFCRRSVAGWQNATGDRIDYAPFQAVADQFPEIPREEFAGAVQLIEADGGRYRGAEAVFRVMAQVPGKRWWLGLYRRVPGFAPLANLGYRWVANHRGFVSSISQWFWGDHVGPSTYWLSRRLFLRFVGAIYFVAFLSFGVQARGLIGEQGILPVGEYLQLVQNAIGSQSWYRLPTLCWLTSTDWFLTWGLCGGGAVASVLLMLGVAPAAMLVVAWVFYLSIVSAGQVFLSFQWDILLLEAGFLAIFYAPLTFWLSSSRAHPPSGVVRFLLAWLLFRLLLESGIVKLTAGDHTWHDLTALLYHYETQPLPAWPAWYAHHLPIWFQKLSTVLMFLVELIVPFFLFAPRRLRHAACAAIVGLMLFIGLTGNYNFFNFLTAALCIPLLDDALLAKISPRRVVERIKTAANFKPMMVRRSLLAILALFLFTFSVLDAIPQTAGVHRKALPEWLATPPKWVQRVDQFISPYRIVNSYGLFRVMTTVRNEIVIEGSLDGRNWVEYEFKWKPGDVMQPPGWVQPHQPRLDWQMWFAALSHYERLYWFKSFQKKLLNGEPAVLGLLARDPFPGDAPRYIRAKLYRYRFSKPDVSDGAWWTRELVGNFSPTITRR